MAIVAAKLRLSDRLNELTKKNDEYSRMVQRLLKTVEEEKSIHEKRVHELMREYDNQLRNVQKQCRDEKLELIGRNLEIEREMKELLDKNKDNQLHHSDRLVRALEVRLLKTTAELGNRNKALGEVEEDRDRLKGISQHLETAIKEQQESTQNFKMILEAEVSELRSRLRMAEERNMELIQKGVNRIIPAFPALVSVQGDSELVVAEAENSETRLMVAGQENRNWPRKSSPGENSETSEGTRLRTPSAQYPSISQPPDSELHSGRRSYFFHCPNRRNYPRELLCLILSALLFSLSYYVRTLGSDCHYERHAYSQL